MRTVEDSDAGPGHPNPALRDEVPACWTGEARGVSGTFRFPEGVRPWNWLELDAEEAEKLWTLLVDFVAYFNARYGNRPDRRIPPCWSEHGALVEELTTLCLARWQAFASPHSSIGGAQYWHSYTLPGFLTRLREWLGDDLLACQQGRHRDRFDPPLDTGEGWVARSEVVATGDVDKRRRAGDSDANAEGDIGAQPLVEIPFIAKNPDTVPGASDAKPS